MQGCKALVEFPLSQSLPQSRLSLSVSLSILNRPNRFQLEVEIRRPGRQGPTGALRAKFTYNVPVVNSTGSCTVIIPVPSSVYFKSTQPTSTWSWNQTARPPGPRRCAARQVHSGGCGRAKFTLWWLGIVLASVLSPAQAATSHRASAQATATGVLGRCWPPGRRAAQGPAGPPGRFFCSPQVMFNKGDSIE
jgi:hypothetical protein